MGKMYPKRPFVKPDDTARILWPILLDPLRKPFRR